ncbi:MAG: YicC family protein [Bacteriovoracaceae bacterium]|nr:YicC family protein [Bacteriovoracaceae bacterium]
MQVQSMTGLGRAEGQNAHYRVIVEIKSVNHRFRDFRFRIPASCAALEIPWRQQVQTTLGRGSFEVVLSVQAVAGTLDLALDQTKVETYLKMIQKPAQAAGVTVVAEAGAFLRPEFALPSANDAEIKTLAAEVFTQALLDLKRHREEEGQKLQQVLQDYLSQYAQLYQEVRQLGQDLRPQAQAKLTKAWAEAQKELSVDETRFNQELIYYLEKWDIAEELERINLHQQKLATTLAGGQEIGRTIEFLLQELHRETNTIGSKSMLGAVSERVVQMKVLLERMREQVANLA